MLRAFIQAKQRQKWDNQRLWAFQQAKAKAMVRWTLQHAPLYREHWVGYDPNDWQTLPVIDKVKLIAGFERWNVARIPLQQAQAAAIAAETVGARHFNGLTLGLSSGTSGQPGLFIVSDQERRAWAGTILARVLHRLQPERIAFFLRANSDLYQTVHQPGILMLEYFSLVKPLADIIGQLNHLQPTLLIAPASMLLKLAAEVEVGALQIKPRRVISVAEVLELADQQLLDALFGVKVEQIYQASEGFLAAPCRSGQLHWQSDVVAVTFKDLGQGYVTPIITDLWRKTQPLIRYALGDVLRLGQQRCSCGSDWPVIERVVGRLSDVLYGQKPDGQWQPLFADQVSGAMIEAFGPLQQYRPGYQLIQTAPNQLKVSLDVSLRQFSERISAVVERRLGQLWLQHGCQPPNISFAWGLPVRAAHEKRRQVQRHCQIVGVDSV
jgi:putative adenylate-forming enzyme